jgi:hypothetical protein
MNQVEFTQEDLVVRGGRCGTVECSKEQLIALFGKPQDVGSADDKVTIRWVFTTPLVLSRFGTIGGTARRNGRLGLRALKGRII